VRLAGKVALISGAARGQGAAEARMFAREGAAVVLGDVLAELGRDVARDISDAGGRAVFLPLDVTRADDWSAAVELAESSFGRLDVLVNNAGILGRPGILATTIEQWERVVAVNQTGPFLGMRAAIPAMRRAGGGSIVNISSALAEVGYGESASYTAAKGALTALTRTVAVELAPEGHPRQRRAPRRDRHAHGRRRDGRRRGGPRCTARGRADAARGPRRGGRRRRAVPRERRGVVRHRRNPCGRRGSLRLVTATAS
jgi:cyclopentanol dehydrogenase